MSSRRTIGELLDAARERIDRLSPEMAWAGMDAGDVLVDLRCQESRAETGVVPESLHIPLSVLYWRLDPGSEYANTRLTEAQGRVILMCAHGYSSSLAAATLRDLGYERATDVIGGFEAWAAAGLPVVALPQPKRASRIRPRTTKPDAAVTTATAPIANGIPARSASTPATMAPTANPRSRQRR